MKNATNIEENKKTIPEQIKVFQTKSKDGKYTFWKYRQDETWYNVYFKTTHRPNFSPVICDTTDCVIDDDSEYPSITIVSDNFSAPYYNTETKEIDLL